MKDIDTGFMSERKWERSQERILRISKKIGKGGGLIAKIWREIVVDWSIFLVLIYHWCPI